MGTHRRRDLPGSAKFVTRESVREVRITGNMGYVGTVVVEQLRRAHPDAVLAGFDMGYFAAVLCGARPLPESYLDVQYFGDIRRLPQAMLSGSDAVVHLAAISNDPMGRRFEDVTFDISHRATVRLASLAKAAGVSHRVVAYTALPATRRGRRIRW